LNQANHPDLCWRVEQACLEAWPAAQTIDVNGWLARLSGGPTRRTNSVNPQRHGPRDPTPSLPALAELYSAAGQPLIFRVPTIAEAMDAALDRLGFGPPEAETMTLLAGLTDTAAAAELNDRPDTDWLEARARLSGEDAEASAVFRAMIANLAAPARFAATRSGDGITSIAYGAIRQGLLVIETVATDPAARRRGLARRTVGALMHWGMQSGADGACLQVVADNDAAVKLYRSLGFDRELYRYHYRRPGRGPA